MARTHAMILFLALACGTGCQHTKRGQFPTPDGSAMVTFQVHGMMKAKSGATWMAWPNAVTASLEGINGTKSVTWDYARDLVIVEYDPLAAEPSAFAAAIAKLGYDAKAPSRQQSKKSVSKQLSRVYVPADAPKFFVDAIKRARAAQRPIIIDFWAEWCTACLRLKRETLEHSETAEVLRAIELIYVDLDKYPALGEAYCVVAIPDVFLIDSSGRIVDRMQHFVPPKAFVTRVRKALGQPYTRDTGDR